jgi:GT2 family glycosyltransferase
VERVLFAPRELPPLRPDVASEPGPYSDWITRRERQRRHAPPNLPPSGMLHLVMAIPGEPPAETLATLQSLERQSIGQWTMTVAIHESWRTSFTSLLAVSGLRRSSQRVRLENTPDASSEPQMLSHAMGVNADSNVALIFPGDVWPEHAIELLSSRISPRAVVYADEDCMNASGEHTRPRLKPDYSPDFHLRSSYVGRPLAIGSEVVGALALSAFDAGPEVEHDIALHACELADTVHHIPEVLCHRLVDPPTEVRSSSHVVAALERRHIAADVSIQEGSATFRIALHNPHGKKASLIVPFRDEPRLLRTCVESIESTRGHQDVEFILVNNGSVQPETLTLIEKLETWEHVRVLNDDRPFNWAQLNNAAARTATGEILIFLNNDIEALEGGWLEALCAQVERPDIGVVGARLLYPNRRVQHCGVVIGLGGAAGHILVGLEETSSGYLNMATTTRECGAVTGACFATTRDVFSRLDGFDESLGIDLNDIDYCLRAQRAGLRVIYEAGAELIHHESPSRGTAGDVRDIVHFIDRWRQSILDGDPYLNGRLTRVDSSCALRGPGEGAWWQQWNESLSRL